MQEKELRLALICYGGVSLAVYMHGITKEIWRAARASQRLSCGDPDASPYARLLGGLAQNGLRLRVLTDIVAGASAGGINGIFLAHAIETGQSLDPLTDMWLKMADADVLLDPDARPINRFTKFWAAPILWLVARRRNDAVSLTVAPETQEEVRRKLSNFIRARWFAPPFGGEGFCTLLLDAFDAMAAGARDKPLLPDRHPLDLFVTVTDFHGHEEQLLLNSPPQVNEKEHRLSIAFSADGPRPRSLGDANALAFAARATASFPGAFPPFTVREMDAVLKARNRAWPQRDSFLARILPRQFARGTAEDTVLVDGSVLANAPFADAIGVLRNRPARRPVDRRFVYIEPTPSGRAIGRMPNRQTDSSTETDTAEQRLPGFFRTIFGAVSDIPREQPIRDNLERIAARSQQIRRLNHVVDALRPDIDASVESAIGRTIFLNRPTPRRLANWRRRTQARAVVAAGFTYSAYAHLKLSRVVEDAIAMLFALGGDRSPIQRESFRAAIWRHVRQQGLDRIMTGKGRFNPDTIAFFRRFDLGFRLRRLRFLARHLARLQEQNEKRTLTPMRDALYEALGRYSRLERAASFGDAVRACAATTIADPQAALDALGDTAALDKIDVEVEARLSAAFYTLEEPDRRSMVTAYIGFPFFDIATLPILQGEGLDEYDPIKVDRISPDDATAIRSGGAEATLKGVEFNHFGAFFSRGYRENDYLWGRLHGCDRLIDIVHSAAPVDNRLSAADITRLKHDAFLAILDEEAESLTLSQHLIATLRDEIMEKARDGVK